MRKVSVCPSVCPSVRLAVKRVDYDKTIESSAHVLIIYNLSENDHRHR